MRLLFELPRSIFYCKIQRFAPNLTFKPSPNTAPATQKCHLNFTKYYACQERLTYLVLIAYETSFTVRGATGVTIQPHQILRLPRKMTRTALVVITYETSFPMRGATGVTIQPHQILRLPRKMTRLLYRPHI